MTRMRFAMLALLALLATTTSVKGVDKDKLRRAACLPQYGVVAGLKFSGTTGFSLDRHETPLSERIAASRRLLQANPKDAEGYVRLGGLYAKAGSQAEWKAAYTHAAELCRQHLEKHPNDISGRLTLAEALQGLDKDDEAEALLFRAVKDSPDNWRCWLAWAEHLGSKSMQTIMGDKPWHYNSPLTLLQAMQAAKPTKERIAASQPFRKESAACFDRAIALAPREAKLYRRRAAHRGLYNVIDCGYRMYMGEKVDPVEIYLFPSALDDIRRVAELSGDDYVAIGTSAFLEASKELFEYQSHHPASKPPAKWMDVLSPATRKRLSENLKRLEKGMRDPDKTKAATACMFLGSLQMALADERTAEKSFRQCIELDPERDDAWDMLTALLETNERYSEALDLCRRRVKHKDSARNRFFLAKAYEYLDQLDKAEDEIRSGLKLDPDDFMLNLALADVFLMHSKNDDLKSAGELLCKVGKNLNSKAAGEHHWMNYTYACGIFYGLRGDVGKARRVLREVQEVQKREPVDLPVKEALQALGESLEPVAPPPLPGRFVSPP